jgi:hypothetical protein
VASADKFGSLTASRLWAGSAKIAGSLALPTPPDAEKGFLSVNSFSYSAGFGNHLARAG